MQPALRISIFALVSITVFQGCYCFRAGSHQNVRYPHLTSNSPLCNWTGTGGLGLQLNGYYEFRNTDLQKYKVQYVYGVASSYNEKSFGQAGFRAEKYVSPFGIIPEAVLGLGLDYSYSYVKLSYDHEVNNVKYYNRLGFDHHRLLGSANLIVMVQGYWMAYTTMQVGLNFSKGSMYSTDPKYVFASPQRSPSFEYRAGMGLQYYFDPRFGITFEGGYGGGVNVRTGFCYWIW